MKVHGFRWLVSVLSFIPVSANADTFAYDARGRLVSACNMMSGEVHRIEHLLDKNDNRLFSRNFPVVVMIPTNSGSGSQNVVIVQSDSNLVIYNQEGRGPVWSRGTSGKTCARMSMQADGNLVIYNLSLKPIWSSDSGGH